MNKDRKRKSLIQLVSSVGLVFVVGCGGATESSGDVAVGDQLTDVREALDVHETSDIRDVSGRDESVDSEDIYSGEDTAADLNVFDDTFHDAPFDAPDYASNDLVVDPDVSVGDTDDSVEDSSDIGVADVPGIDTVEACNPTVFDMAMIQDASTINCQFTNHRTVLKETVLVDVWDVSYTSWDSIDCKLQPITIRGYASKPVSATSNVPGIVQMHGLGGCAYPDNATGPAALLGYYVLAPTGPGGVPGEDHPDCAASEGLSAGYDNGYRLFDTVPDPRGSWIWGHAVAAMRGLTCLATRSEVDDNRLGMTGYSAGAVATLISSGVDNRIKVSVPLSGTGAWGVATQAAAAWQHSLLTLAGLDTTSPQWLTLISTIVPDVLMPGTATKIMMVNGSSDEFFPLTAHMATYNAIPHADKRTSIFANGDHGCCLLVDNLCGLETTETIEARSELAGKGNQRAWFHHWFGTDSDYSYYPSAPLFQVSGAGAATYVLAAVDGGGSKLDVESVKFWLSNDDAFNFFSQELKWNGTLSAYDGLAPVALQANSIYYIEVIYKTGALVFPERFLLASEPHIPAGMVPHIHNISSCVD
jgi:cephalosporin-C deacetylase-like acetyl esterase